MDRLRVVLSTLDLAPTVGGIQTMTREVIERSSRLELNVVAPADDGWREADRNLEVAIKRVRSIASGRRGFIPALALATRREVLRPGSVGVAMHPNAALGFLGVKQPFAVFTHGGELLSPRIRRVARWVFPRAGRVLCNSRFTRSEAVALGADPLRCEVLPPGAPERVDVNPAEIDRLRKRYGGPFVLTVARLVPHKGHDVVIDALPRLPGVRAVFVGTGPNEGHLNALALARGVSDRVVFAGRVSDDEISAHYAAADAFLLLSRAVSIAESAGIEGAGIAILEAMSMGTPVVAAATGGIPETVIDGKTGRLVDPKQAEAVARTISDVLSNQETRTRITQGATSLVTQERSWGRFVERFEDALLLLARP